MGEAGYCRNCRQWMPDGPDVCLGYLPGVSHGCCGHGEMHRAYVTFGNRPDEPQYANPDLRELRGIDALRWFESQGCGP